MDKDEISKCLDNLETNLLDWHDWDREDIDCLACREVLIWIEKMRKRIYGKDDDMSENEKLLERFVEHEREASRIGSGDDMFYEQQIVDYINKQRKMWLGFIDFIKKEEVKKQNE